jgi:hypothetical protein
MMTCLCPPLFPTPFFSPYIRWLFLFESQPSRSKPLERYGEIQPLDSSHQRSPMGRFSDTLARTVLEKTTTIPCILHWLSGKIWDYSEPIWPRFERGGTIRTDQNEDYKNIYILNL